jgi:NADH-quinone oxidoreductase subunit N
MNLFLTPEALLTLWAIGLLVVSACFSNLNPAQIHHLSMLGVALVFLSTWIVPAAAPKLWANLYVVDNASYFFKHIFLISTFFVLWISSPFVVKLENARKEFFILPLFTTVGLCLIASANDFIMLFVALELVVISFYILIACQRNNEKSLEAAIKYLILGALSTAFYVMGVAFLIGTLGSAHFSTILCRIEVSQLGDISILFAVILIVSALAFKIAAIPFHSWAPDVYQAAPTPVTAFLATASKAAGFIALLRIFWLNALSDERWQIVLGVIFALLAIFSVGFATFAALFQTNFKRLLGYSSIAHTGFLLMAMSCASVRGVHAIFFYIATYVLALFLAFLIISILEDKIGENIANYIGLSQRSPLLAFGLLVALASLAGLPPAVGFFAKLNIFAALWEFQNYLLFGIGIFCALVGIYYYLSPVCAMYWQSPPQSEKIPVPKLHAALIIILILAILFLGIFPQAGILP